MLFKADIVVSSPLRRRYSEIRRRQFSAFIAGFSRFRFLADAILR